jgi:hypothetical protein
VQLLIVSMTWLGLASVVGGEQGTGFWPNHWPMFFQVVLGLVVAEFGLYWAHRIAHEWMPLWWFHAVHHSSKKLWFFNTGRFHIIDTLKSMIFSAPLLALAGAPKDVVLWFGAITAYIGFLTHANIQMRFGWLNYIFNTPAPAPLASLHGPARGQQELRREPDDLGSHLRHLLRRREPTPACRDRHQRRDAKVVLGPDRRALPLEQVPAAAKAGEVKHELL